MCKTVNDFSNLSQLFEGEENTLLPAADDFKTEGKTEIAATVAYLIGLKEELFDKWFASENAELVSKLRKNSNACHVRDLCILRMQLLNNYANTESEILYNLANINRLDWFDQEAIKRLNKDGIPVVKVSCRADEYSVHFTKLIRENVALCADLFPDWIRFDYVKDLFYHPCFEKDGVLKKEFNLFHANKPLYPYSLYIHWNPSDVGNLLISDSKLVKTIYAQHGETFTDHSKLHDAVDYTKKSIYDFIDHSKKSIIVVDCENSDVFKLYGVLKNLSQEEIEKIEKIVLYDDYHTTSAWTWLDKFVSIPVEYEEVERVTDHKSLVDIKMTAGVCKAFYQDDVDSFILCSSDSDFWGLISSLPNADFLVMYEYSKCGQAIKDALDTRGIFHCSMDDFYTGNASDLQKAVLLHELRSRTDTCIGKNCMDITREIYETLHISAKESEMKHFCDKYVRSMRLRISADGVFYVEVTEG